MTEAHPQPLPSEIRSTLDRLRSRLRRYILIEGIAITLIAIALVFWVSFGLDWGYFQLSRLELPRPLRQLIAIGAVCLFVGLVLTWIVFRLARKMQTKALALVLERRFPELDDRLVTAVELSDNPEENSAPLSRLMATQTIHDASHATERLELGDVFNRGPLRRNVVIATLLVVSIVAFCTTNAEAFGRWRRAFLSWDDTYWDRQTGLVAKVVVPPDGELRDFTEGVYKHPRGADLELQVFVSEGKSVPETVSLYYRKDDGRGEGEKPMTKVGDDMFTQKIENLSDSASLWITGGDFTTRRPYRVEVVDPPEIDNAYVLADYPDYTGYDDEPTRTNFRVRSEEQEFPEQTAIVLKAEANKSLTRIVLETDLFKLDIPRDGVGTLSYMRENDLEETVVSLTAKETDFVFANTDDNVVRLPLKIVPVEQAETLRNDYQPGSDPLFPVASDADESVRLFLEDSDAIFSRSPYRIRLIGIPDQVPEVVTDKSGVRRQITRLAKVPLIGSIEDDYGLRTSNFEYRIYGLEEAEAKTRPEKPWEQRVLETPSEDNIREFTLGTTERLLPGETQPTERFDVASLNLREGQGLSLSVVGTDAIDQTGRGRIEEFVIVSPDELRGLIDADQLRQVTSFKDVIAKLERVRVDLAANAGIIVDADTVRQELRDLDGDSDGKTEALQKLDKLDDLIMGTIESGLHDLRTGGRESLAVERAFRGFVLEQQNNVIDDPAVTEKMEREIFTPLSRINGTFEKEGPLDFGLFERTDRSLGQLRVAQEDAVAGVGSSKEELQAAVTDVTRLIEEMKRVLGEMEDLIQFNRAIKTLQSIMNDQERLKKDSVKEQLDKQGLGDLLDP